MENLITAGHMHDCMTRHVLFDALLERYTRAVQLVGGSSPSRQTTYCDNFEKKKRNIYAHGRVTAPSLAHPDRQSYSILTAGYRVIAFTAFALHTDTSATIPTMSRDVYKHCHDAMYSFKTGCILHASSPKSYSSFITIVGSSTTAGPSASAPITLRQGGI